MDQERAAALRLCPLNRGILAAPSWQPAPTASGRYGKSKVWGISPTNPAKEDQAMKGSEHLLRRNALLAGLGLLGAYGVWRLLRGTPAAAAPAAGAAHFEVEHTEPEWRALLTAEQFAVLRQEATERPFSSALNHEKRHGTFSCAGCALALFSSDTKFDSGTGWPSFWKPLDNAVATTEDRTLGMVRTEVHCRRCGGHLGHVFDDGPPPTGLRYCMNGLALKFDATAGSAS
jgi:peptide-methionine (R)-S-oxide reductase